MNSYICMYYRQNNRDKKRGLLCIRFIMKTRDNKDEDGVFQKTLYRKNDYAKSSSKNKSLMRRYSLFSSAEYKYYVSGSCSLGPHVRLDKQPQSSIYFIAPHNPCEYFATEIMLRIGFVSPKCRILTSNGKANTLISSQEIEGYIPMRAIRQYSRKGKSFEGRFIDKKLIPLRERYRLDIEKQIIHDYVESKEYRLSGNLFGGDIAALLINDRDFQSDEYNFGVVKLGSRFYAAAIDKEAATFNGDNYQEFAGDLTEITDDILFKSRTEEQMFEVLYQIEEALVTDANGVCDFDRIFLNPRIQSTPQLLALSPATLCDNLKRSALSILSHYKKNYGEYSLKDYAAREILRNEIARVVMEKVECDASQYSSIINTIVEDLRGPYYCDLFSDPVNKYIREDDVANIRLLDAVLADVAEEYGCVVRENIAQKRMM